MKAKLIAFFGQFWFLKYKKVPIAFKNPGYHCRECEAECEYFNCPCNSKEKLIKRFK
jgi:hypothetical protein